MLPVMAPALGQNQGGLGGPFGGLTGLFSTLVSQPSFYEDTATSRSSTPYSSTTPNHDTDSSCLSSSSHTSSCEGDDYRSYIIDYESPPSIKMDIAIRVDHISRTPGGVRSHDSSPALSPATKNCTIHDRTASPPPPSAFRISSAHYHSDPSAPFAVRMDDIEGPTISHFSLLLVDDEDNKAHIIRSSPMSAPSSPLTALHTYDGACNLQDTDYNTSSIFDAEEDEDLKPFS